MSDTDAMRKPETDERRIVREARIETAGDIAHELMGGCMSMAIVAERIGVDLDDDLEESILLRAFQCHACGWWHSVEELNNLTERELCDSCHAEENPEEDDESAEASATPKGGGGTGTSAVLDAVVRSERPTRTVIVADVVFAHVGSEEGHPSDLQAIHMDRNEKWT